MIYNRSFRPFANLLDLEDLLLGAKKEIANLTSPINLDITESEDSYFISANLPGVSKDQVDMVMRNGNLTITVKQEEVKQDLKSNEQSTELVDNAEKENIRKPNIPNFLLRERRQFNTTRTLSFGDKASDNVSAKLENGVLSIVVKKVNPEDGVKKIMLD